MSEEIIWNNPITGGYILLYGEVMERLINYRQMGSGTREAGGLLLGYRRGPHFEIIDATVPFPRDVRKRTFFDRCDPAHERYALKQWAHSSRTIDYLGEWHTHPEEMPDPSHLDVREWRMLLRPRRPPLVFFIIGTVGIWVGSGNSIGIKPCNSYSTEMAAADTGATRLVLSTRA